MKKLLLVILLVCAAPALKAASENRYRFLTEQSVAAQIDPADFTCLQSEHFTLYLENGLSSNGHALELLETVRNRFMKLVQAEGYGIRSAEPFTWVWFENRNRYEEYSRWADGIRANSLKSYYSARTNRVAVLTDTAERFRTGQAGGSFEESHQISASDYSDDLTAGTSADLGRAMLTHELIHQLAFNTGLQKRGVEYPLWVSEGMATAFEYIFRDPQLREGNRYREQTVLALYDQNRLVPLDVFVSMSRLNWPGLTDTEIYAQCCTFFDFLWHHRKPQLKRFLARAASRRPGSVSPEVLASEFTDSFGPLDRLERDWTNWLFIKSLSR